MRCAIALTSPRTFLEIAAILVCWLTAFPIPYERTRHSRSERRLLVVFGVLNASGVVGLHRRRRVCEQTEPAQHLCRVELDPQPFERNSPYHRRGH
jgi:hypothetical protein